MKSFNAVGFTIWGIPSYIFFAGIGIVVSISVFIILLAEKKYTLQTNMRILFITAIFVILSARLFGCISGIYRDIGMGNSITIESIKNTGIVFYGGLVGLLVTYSFLIRITKQDVYIMDVLAVCIPLFHSIARIGCFFSGCCFGKEINCFIAINYTTMVFNEIITAYRIPTQLIESFFNFCLFVYLFFLFKSEEWKSKKILRRYLLIYSVGRFIIEFFRGDIIRGVIYGVSYSQLISIFIWIYLMITRKNNSETTLKEEKVL